MIDFGCRTWSIQWLHDLPSLVACIEMTKDRFCFSFFFPRSGVRDQSPIRLLNSNKEVE